MVSVQTRVATQLVRMLGVKRRLKRIAAVAQQPAELAKLVAKTRRADRPEPPRRLQRSWNSERLDIDGCVMHLLTGSEVEHARCILYLHGGGYVFGPFAAEWAAAGRIAAAAQCDLAVPIYPKAPEHDVSRTVAVVAQAYSVLEERYGADRLILIGTSAGGGLAVVAMERLHLAGRSQPSCAILLSPGVDMTLEDDVAVLEDGDVMLSAEYVRAVGAMYAGEAEVAHPDVSPIFGDLVGLAPMHVYAASREILYPSLARFVDKAKTAGTEATLIVGTGQQHTWPIAPTPEGREALQQIIETVGEP